MRLIIDDVGEMNLMLYALGVFKQKFRVTPENEYFINAINDLKEKVQTVRDITYATLIIGEDVWNEYFDKEDNYVW